MTVTEWFDIDGYRFERDGCVTVRDLTPLLSGSALRGRNTLVPHVANVIVNPLRETETFVDLELLIRGDNDSSGVPWGNYREGLALNVAELRSEVAALTGTTLRTGALHWHGLDELTKPCRVVAPLACANDGPLQIRAVLSLSFPEGLFDVESWVEGS